MERPLWTFVPRGTAAEIAHRSRVLQDKGVAGVYGTQVYGPPWAVLSAAAAGTTTLGLGSGIAIAHTRSPFETAMCALDLDRLSGGRFVLGLGTGPRDWAERYFGVPYERPVTRLADVIGVVRHVEQHAHRADMPPFEGQITSLSFPALAPTAPPARPRLPIWVAALREPLCRLAGQVADGLIGHPMWSVEWALDQAMAALAEGCARAGRDRAEVQVQPWVTVSIDRRAADAVALAKPNVAFYASIAQYRPYFDAHGFGNEADRLAESAAAGRLFAEADRLVPDEMARSFIACGEPDQVAERIEPLWDVASSMLVAPVRWGLSREQATAQFHACEALFGV